MSVSTADLRRDAREVLNEVEHHGAHAIVTRYGVPAAVIVPVPWYEQAKADGIRLRDIILGLDEGSEQ